MSEYIVQHDTMVNIANAIRTLTGTEDALSPSQIVAAIEDEAAGSGSGGLETCTVTIGAWAFDEISYTGANGLVIKEDAYSTTEIQKEVQKGTIFYGYCEDSTIYEATGSATVLFQDRNRIAVAVEGDCEIVGN